MNILCLSCDVTKDLLTPYLDGICSDESRTLVENHLKECADCREFLAKLQEQDLGKEAPSVDFLKKTKKTIKHWSVAAVSASLFLLLLLLLNTNQSKFMTNHYYWGMPLVMFVFFFAVSRNCRPARPEKWTWLLPFGGVAVTIASITLSLLCWLYAAEKLPSPIPPEKLGPVMHYGYILLSLAAILLLIVMTDLAHRKQQFFPFSQNLAWLGFALAMVSDDLLYRMDTPEHCNQFILRSIGILTVEFVAVTTVLIVTNHTSKS